MLLNASELNIEVIIRPEINLLMFVVMSSKDLISSTKYDTLNKFLESTDDSKNLLDYFEHIEA